MSSSVADRLSEIHARAPLDEAWLVGGSVRDLLLDRPVSDIDLVVEDDPGLVAKSLARSTGGSPFPLSERHGAWRVVATDHTIDVTRCRGTLEQDMALRDFTINAIAIPITGGEPIDPSGGRGDLEAGLLRAVSDTVFDDDPLRLLRLPRIAHELGFGIEQGTARLAAERAPRAAEPSAERIFMEMRRLIGGQRPAEGLRLADGLGVLDAVLPEVTPLRGVLQSSHHQLDVWEHTLHVVEAVADIGDHPAHYLPAHAERLEAELGRTVGDELSARQALRFAALFHDIRKPQTRREANGRIGFMGHDAQGAEAVASILGRWKASNDLIRFCRVLVREHLALGFSIPSRPLGLRVAHRYLRATAPWPASSVALSLADRLATRGPSSRLRHLRRHSETADEMLALIAELEADRRPPLLRGDEIADQLGVQGAAIGRLVELLAEEQAAGTVTTREEALVYVREQV
jgi:tRNA nucleotidyltransferase/poly(A) polymerase